MEAVVVTVAVSVLATLLVTEAVVVTVVEIPSPT